MSKLDEVRAAVAKAGVPTALAIPTKRGSKGRKKTAPEKPENLEEAWTKAQHELKELRSKRTDLEGRLRKALASFQSEKQAHEKLKRACEQTEEVLAKLRKAIGAGKDSRASELPGRVSALKVKLGEIEAEKLASEGRERLLQQQLEGLQQEIQAKEAEIDRLQREAEPLILEGGTALIEAPPTAGGQIADQEGQGEAGWSQVDEVVPTFFTSFVTTESLQAVKERYSNWVLGFGPYRRARSNRLSQGVNADWGVVDLLATPPVKLEGESGTSLDIRDTEDGWVVRFVHPDWQFEGTAWWNIARVSADEDGVRVEHAMIRLTGAHAQRPGTSTIPNILKDLFPTAEKPYPWEDFRGEHKLIHRGNARIFVEGVLLNKERDLPVVVVSSCRQSHAQLVKPENLAKALMGLAVVFVVDPDEPFLLSDELEQQGFGKRMYSCFDGGVRMYLPGLNQTSDPFRHTLWARSFLEKKEPGELIKLITRRVAAHSVGLRVPQGFGRIIEDHDLKVVTEASSKMIGAKDADQILAFQKQVKALTEALDRARNEAQQLPSLRQENLELKGDLETLYELDHQRKEEVNLLKRELDESSRRIFNLKSQKELIEQMAKESSEAASAFRPELIDGVLRGDWSPICGYLRLLQARYPDRLVVLESAFESAQDCEIEFREKAESLLYTLVTDYYDARVDDGDEEAAAHRVFGKDLYAPNEGEFLSVAGARARTFVYEGEEVCMLEHLKITKGLEKHTSRKVFRTYFYWDGQRKKIVIGHVGRHLPE